MNAPDTAVFARTACALLCLVALAACERSATQLVPIVRSDLASEQIRCVLAEAGPVRAGAGFEVTDTHVFEIGPDAPRVRLPFSFGLPPPGGERSARVELHVSALSSCEDPSDPDVRTVTRTVRSGFVPQQKIGLPIFLAASCVDVICPETQTCEGGVCVAIPDVDPGTLTPITPGTELAEDAGARDVGPSESDAGAGAVVGTLPASLVPRWGVSAGSMFDFPGNLNLIGLADEDAIVGGTTDTGGTFDGTVIPPSTVLIARIRPDGTTRWIHMLATPATGLDLQSFGVGSALLAAPSGTPRLYVCGFVGEGGLSDSGTGTTWDARETGTFAPSDAWLASFDPDTGALGRVVTLHSLSTGDVSTSCRPFTTRGDDVTLAVTSYNGSTAVTSIELTGGSIPLTGSPTSAFGTILALDPAFDETRPGVFATLVAIFPGASTFRVVGDGTGGFVVAGSGFNEPAAPLAAGTPRMGPTLVVARLAPDGRVTWRNRILGSRTYVNVSGLSVSAGSVTLSAQSTSSMTTGPYALQVGETGTAEALPWPDDPVGRGVVTIASFDLDDGALVASQRLPENTYHRIALTDATGEVIVVGSLFDGDDVGFGPYTPMGDADMSLLRMSPMLDLTTHVEWTSDGTTRDELGTTLLTPGGVLYLSGSTALDGTATLAPGVVVSGEFLTRL